MRRIFGSTPPDFRRILLIESGPRSVSEKMLRYIYAVPGARVDLLTCFEDIPSAFDRSRGSVIHIKSREIAAHRARFLLRTAGARYTTVAILCTGTAVLKKWKWVLALLVPAKLAIVGENGGFFFFDTGHLGAMKAMLRQRLRVGAGSLPFQLLGELLVLPFTLGYLFVYAGGVHVRRLLRRPVMR